MVLHCADLWVPLSECLHPVDVCPMLAPKLLTRRYEPLQVRLVGGHHQILGGLMHTIERRYHHPLLELDAVFFLIHMPRPLLILARLWAAGESQRSREGTGRVKRAIFLPIGAPDPERLLTLLADWHPVLLVVPPRCWHEGRVRRARGCAGEVRVPALPVRMQGRRDKKLSASQMATGNNAKKNTMSWQRLSDCYTLRVHQ